MIYISSSWKNRERVRALAISLRQAGYEVYDFTDPACRNTPEISPERFPEQFDPEQHIYSEYIKRPEWRGAVECNREALSRCTVCLLLLPCGADAHSDWSFAVGRGKVTAVVGHPSAGERTPSHLWADAMLDSDDDVLGWLNEMSVHQAGRMLPHDDPRYGHLWAGWAEAFLIFASYGSGKYMTQAEHDEVWAGPDPDDVSAEDIERLEALGWFPASEGGFHKKA